MIRYRPAARQLSDLIDALEADMLETHDRDVLAEAATAGLPPQLAAERLQLLLLEAMAADAEDGGAPLALSHLSRDLRRD